MAVIQCHCEKDVEVNYKEEYIKLTDVRLARLIIDSEALVKELALCECQEVNYGEEENQRSGER